LVLSVAKLARGREGYYLATVASQRQATGTLIEPEGRWLGHASALLGLVGEVDSEALRALLAGVDPASGQVLSAHHDKVRVAAFDCTCSTPKSVSVLGALGPDEVRAHVHAGHEEAAAAALGYLERCGARVRRTLARGGAPRAVPAEGFVAAAFLHRTSRAPDPHLHSHVLVANLAPGPDGRWSALDARGLFLELRTARDLYETQLRFELTRRLGVSWRELQGAWADLAGIDPSVSRAFSRRSADIETALVQAGRSGPRAARIASVRTRPVKDLATPYEELVQDWRERSYRLGVSDGRLASVVGRSPVASLVPADSTNERDRWADRALGEHGAAARDGTCRRGDLVRSRCASLPLGAQVTEVERDVERLLADGLIVPVPSRAQPSARRLQSASGRSIPGGMAEPLYTTPAILEVHARLTQIVREHPEAVELLAYPPGGRLDALDALSDGFRRSDGGVAAIAPGRAAAGSFESVTGIETTAVAGGQAARAVSNARVLAVAEAQRLGPWELSSVVESSVAGGGRVVLFAPSTILETEFCTAAVLAPHLSPFVVRAGSGVAPAGVSGVGGRERHCFAGREVIVVADGPAAREALLTAWRQSRASGRRSLIAVSDDAVIRTLRDSVREAGGSPDEVVDTLRLAGLLAGRSAGRSAGPSALSAAESGPASQIVVLGALPSGVSEPSPAGCVHVAIVPDASEVEHLGRAAEVARPKYLVSELGAVPASASDRSAWRAGATAIEAFRHSWSIEDPEHAVGDRRAMLSFGAEAIGDLAETRRKVREAVRAVDRAMPTRGRATEVPGRSR